jgi:hypothetical protein
MLILIDADSLAGDPELPHLRSFGAVDGFTIEIHFKLVDQPSI